MATTLSGNANESSSSGRLNSEQRIIKKLCLKSIIQNLMKSEETKIINQIEEELKLAREKTSEDDLDLDIVEIDLPSIKTKKQKKVLEAIHNIFQAERIDNKLLIKFNGGMKEKIHFALNVLLRQQLPGWIVPIINSSPPPFLWIEVTFNKTNDRDNALNKILYFKPYCSNTKFVLISISFGTSSFQTNPNPGVNSVVVAAPRADRPSKAPYLGHWAVGADFNAVQWYKMQ
ncbi:35584_t:CDS:2 [Gigaspora margarita]|uniref:35584_t:CDS:1 n=1 Tax=Gigaspora margarita TaxID=4874 RepID=A0ABN7VSJ3_GIGMA|nr:35584_t:CDS:2 [Gigaspora margarita]